MGFATVGPPSVGHRSSAGDEGDAGVKAGGGQHEPGVVDDGQAAVRKQPLQQLLEARSTGGDLGSRGACAARCRTNSSKPAEQGGQPLVDQPRLQGGDVGTRSLGVERAAVRAKSRAACRASDVQA